MVTTLTQKLTLMFPVKKLVKYALENSNVVNVPLTISYRQLLVNHTVQIIVLNSHTTIIKLKLVLLAILVVKDATDLMILIVCLV